MISQPALEAFDPPKPADSSFQLLVRARQMAIDALPASQDQPINPLILPGEARGETGILVYLLAGTSTSNLAVFGRHFRALVQGEDDVSLAYMLPLSRAALELPTKQPNGDAVEALMVTHVVTDTPLETHVFTSLLHELPVYVGTARGVWFVNGDTITLLNDKPPGSE